MRALSWLLSGEPVTFAAPCCAPQTDEIELAYESDNTR